MPTDEELAEVRLRAWNNITENVPVGQVFVTQRFMVPKGALEAFLTDLAEATRRAGGSMFGGTTAEQVDVPHEGRTSVGTGDGVNLVVPAGEAHLDDEPRVEPVAVDRAPALDAAGPGLGLREVDHPLDDDASEPGAVAGQTALIDGEGCAS